MNWHNTQSSVAGVTVPEPWFRNVTAILVSLKIAAQLRTIDLVWKDGCDRGPNGVDWNGDAHLDVADWLQVLLGDVGEGGRGGVKTRVQEHQIVRCANHLLHKHHTA